MAMGVTCNCCGSENATDAEFCRSCGARLADVQRTEAGQPVATSDGLAWNWVGLGVLILFGANLAVGLVLSLVLIVMGITEPSEDVLAGGGILAFGLGGYIVGKRSPGKTIVEPGLSAFFATALVLAYQENFAIFNVVVGGLVPFCAACVGAWLGEKAQGTT